MAPDLVSSVARAFEGGGVDLAAWGLGWARVAPAVTLVPAFGLRALPGPARAMLGLGLALAIAPAVRPVAGASPWVVAALLEVARGLPIALAAAIPLWAATMAGGLVDALRGSSDPVAMPTIEGRPTPLGVLFGMTAAVVFLGTGGPARVASALAAPPASIASPFARAAADLAGGIGLAVGLAAPLLAASIVVEIAGALIARAASPAQLHALLAPLRSLALLGLTALVFDRIAAAIAGAVGGAL